MKAPLNSMTVRTNAIRYQNAMRAISAVGSMNLENSDVLRSVLTNIDREAPNLKFVGSQLIATGLNDYSFMTALRRVCPDKAATVALIKQLRTNRNSLRKLEVAQLFSIRLRQSVEADAARLRSLADRLMHVSGKHERARRKQPVSDPFANCKNLFPDFALVFALLVGYADFVAFGEFLDEFAEFIRFLEAVEACQEAANKKRSECVMRARNQMFPNLAAEVQCGAEWAAQAAQCLLTAISSIATA
ncbi:MAG: hypothetical protein C5B55_10570 [Blastocatellia bacterium]|nr:MAG: hypothetical protein C5B55_10570 [Blastocatellia bacterium]